MRRTMSLRRRSSNSCRMSAACGRSRWTRMVAMICGCSSRISSATIDGSIRLSLSMPELVPLASRMSSIRVSARSLPSALVSTERMWSLDSRLIAAYCSVSSKKSSSTWRISSWETCCRRAISRLTVSTSWVDRYLNTSAALSSSRLSSRIALRRAPLISIIFLHPATDDHGDQARVFLGHFTQVGQVVFIDCRAATQAAL
ncbi:hypothetical protein D3C80_803660 [compost metagenome]